MIKVLEVNHLKDDKYTVLFQENNTKHSVELSLTLIHKYHLFHKAELTKKEYSKLKEESSVFSLYDKALHFIEYQMRTISEVKTHIRKYTNDEVVISELISNLKKDGFLSDSAYVHEYVTQKIEFDLVGPRYIKEKLISKGIHFDLIDDALVKYNHELQYEKCQNLFQKETAYPIKKPYIKAYQSLKRKLINKGFDLVVIEQVMLNNNDLLEETVEEVELLKSELKSLQKKEDINTYIGKQTIKHKLLQKGFLLKHVNKCLEQE